MKKSFSVLAFLVVAATLHAQPFEAFVADSIRALIPEDAFADIGACGVLDMQTIYPFSLAEVADLIAPCMDAVALKYAAKVVAEPGFVSAPRNGHPGQTGLLIKTDMASGSQGHLDLTRTLARRQGHLLAQPVKVLTKDEVAPSAVSALQKSINGCMLASVVRDVRSGEDFVKIYGRCLTQNIDCRITGIHAAEGLSVIVKSDAPSAKVEAYNGFVTINAGKGAVSVMVVAYQSEIVLP